MMLYVECTGRAISTVYSDVALAHSAVVTKEHTNCRQSNSGAFLRELRTNIIEDYSLRHQPLSACYIARTNAAQNENAQVAGHCSSQQSIHSAAHRHAVKNNAVIMHYEYLSNQAKKNCEQ
jgi:hypothetical protein